MKQTEPLINEHEAAKRLGLKVSTLQRWRWAGQPPDFIKIGGAVRYDPAVIEAFIAAGRRPTNNKESAPAYPSTQHLEPDRLQRLFERLVMAAINRERCPTTDQLRDEGHIAPNISKLAAQRSIKIEVYALNWRVVEIMTGPAKGQRTMEAPTKTPPYKVLFGEKERGPAKHLELPDG